MFKLSRLFKALLSVGIMRMTPDDTGGGGGSSGGTDFSGGQGGDPNAGGASNPWDSVPKSWAQEHHAHWNNVSPEVRKIIHDRDSNYERGIQSYRGSHERWNRLEGHFKEYQNTQGFDPVAVYETLAQNHLALAKAPPAERAAMFQKLAEAYGVELTPAQAKAAAAQGAAGQGGQPDGLTKESVQAMMREMLGEALSPFQQHLQRQNQETVQKTVDSFFSDPKNKFAMELQGEILQLLNSGEARSLESAYKLALHANPAVFAKFVAETAQGGAGGGQQGGEPAAGANRNLKSTGDGAPSGKSKSMDDTMNEIAMKAYPGWKPRVSVS